MHSSEKNYVVIPRMIYLVDGKSDETQLGQPFHEELKKHGFDVEFLKPEDSPTHQEGEPLGIIIFEGRPKVDKIDGYFLIGNGFRLSTGQVLMQYLSFVEKLHGSGKP